MGLDFGNCDWKVTAWLNTSSSGIVVTKMGFVGRINPDGWGVSVSVNGTVGAPNAALAGIVANAVLSLIEVHEFRELWRMRRSEFWIGTVSFLSVWPLARCAPSVSSS